MSEPLVLGDVLYGADQIVARFVAARIPEVRAGFEKYQALGVLKRGELVGGVVFHNYHGHDIEMSAVMTDRRWARREVLRRLFTYPFVVLGCARMTTITCADNEAARTADEAMGFKLEGRHPKGWDGVRDAVSYGMLREDCRYLGA